VGGRREYRQLGPNDQARAAIVYELAWQDAAGWQDAGGEARPIPAPPPDRPVERAALLLWQEHCVECAVPGCYSMCPLYVQRRDHKCARFGYGIYPNPQVSGLLGFGADVSFRRWGKIETPWPCQPRLYALPDLRRKTSRLESLERATAQVADALAPIDPKRHLSRFFTSRERGYVKRAFQVKDGQAPSPDALYIKYYLDGEEARRLQLEIAYGRSLYRIDLQSDPGWNEHVIPYEGLPTRPGRTGFLRVWPENDAEVRVVFTWLDLVVFAKGAELPDRDDPPAPAAKVKCVAWDLDDTLWAGIIGEAGPANVSPDVTALDLVKRPDELRLSEYFLYPEINWGPKSQSVRRIAERLNINVDTLAVIDDSSFEREEIASALPQVRVYPPTDIEGLLGQDEFDVPVTQTSRTRRQAYVNEAKRQELATDWGDDYDAFLRSCEMTMRVGPPVGAEPVTRCLELLQRSNQFNLSGRRYSADEFDELLRDPRYECFAAEVSDRFGGHGIVGFIAVDIDHTPPTLFELVMSCRVAKKKVEDTLLLWLAVRLQRRGAQELRARLRVTKQNAPLRRVLSELSFETLSDGKTEQELRYRFAEAVQVPSVIGIEEVSAESHLSDAGA
jgi:FkbH-like protein